MNSRAALALLALIVRAGVRAQPPASVWVNVNEDKPSEDFEDLEDVEKRYTPELVEELETVKGDSLLLFTEFSARASQSYKQFVRMIGKLENDARELIGPGVLEKAPHPCRLQFESSLKQVKRSAHRAAAFSGDNHHKFFLGYMIVFRMHLNKSEEFVKKSERAISNCGIKCETKPQVKRWRRQALSELNRVRHDLEHSRPMYRDLLIHAQRRLNTERKRAQASAKAAVEELEKCASSS